MLMFFESSNFADTNEIVLSKCKNCGSYFFDKDHIGSCCKEETVPLVDKPSAALMKFLIKRRD